MICIRYNTTVNLPEVVIQQRAEESNVFRFISAYREFGHLKANINPLAPNTRLVPELEPQKYGLTSDKTYTIKGLVAGCEETCTLELLQDILNQKYCGHIGAEFSYLPTEEEREWFATALETTSKEALTTEERIKLARDMLRSQTFDNFLATKFQSVKRYGGEGAESMVGFFTEAFKNIAQDGVEQAMIAIAHRGRLNLLTGILQYPPVVMFQKMKGLPEFPPEVKFTGDVLSHLVNSVDLEMGEHTLHVTMLPNPSHLEAVNPVGCGKTRARQRSLGDGCFSSEASARQSDKVVCIQVHGDAALGGQGIMQETLALSEAPHFTIGGALHISINNQVGYTTPGERTRSSTYCTDIAKMCSMPVIHVNGDDPEAVVKAARLAVQYQRKFRRDVFIDLVCWRRWGHNELDNPRFTNPSMYANIDSRRSVPDTYADALVSEGVLTQGDVTKFVNDHMSFLAEQYKLADSYVPKAPHFKKQWSGLVQAPGSIEVWDTGIDAASLKYLGAKSVHVPEGFNMHKHLKKTHIDTRLQKLTDGRGMDWATGEALAMASLLHQGFNIRFCGQDVGRGTFSQRHCMFVDQVSDEMYIPLNHMSETQTNHLEVVNSILSEEAVLGFEYGFSVESPNTLCIWEAQFGDFFNGAQIIIDTFLSSGERKWLTQSGLVMVLPHGYDGAGPEHSSCHIERFLQNCDSSETSPDGEDVNWGIVNPTTPAQYFHLLRRQVMRNYRKPLIIAGPKMILRLPAATSSLEDMAPGTHFLPVLGDKSVSPDSVRKVIFVSGKHYYALVSEREARGISDTAIIRLESLCPFPTKEINDELIKYKKAKTLVWSQEEHRNMGAWTFVHPRFENLCSTKLLYAGRDVSGVAAVGVGQLHKQEIQAIMDKTFNH
ncbi:probable 2-oxoglutarate dehydrogenase E1 component DHKTD1, mitochondrial isoform X2 [Homarus americanus]|uniref:probable 2-oxoglutarate dehydrogenase E1 component DHKTD1, mitochondrial isoform X2 n=1 Tax=Homarus americanus TaxID=6706 RepID=UPI001C497143|nr:probable 2-oxoglutarate dehydrogenase E1 component DHKTD1, mitochondrial isoform X2 [Homarus americanus]